MLLFDGGDHRQPDADHYRVLFERGPSREFPYAIRHTSLDDYAAAWTSTA